MFAIDPVGLCLRKKGKKIMGFYIHPNFRRKGFDFIQQTIEATLYSDGARKMYICPVLLLESRFGNQMVILTVEKGSR